MKPGELRHSKAAAAVEVMRGVKSLLDPAGILNPYKVLPAAGPSPQLPTTPRSRL